jgi:hypothetical protein
MKTAIISLSLMIACIIYVGNPKLSFSPFKLSFETPLYSIGTALAIASIITFKIAMYRDARKEVINQFEQAIEELNQTPTQP